MMVKMLRFKAPNLLLVNFKAFVVIATRTSVMKLSQQSPALLRIMSQLLFHTECSPSLALNHLQGSNKSKTTNNNKTKKIAKQSNNNNSNKRQPTTTRQRKLQNSQTTTTAT